jgi:hypothetical protein
MRRGAEPPLLLERVDLHHHAVGVVAEPVALGLEAGAILEDGVDGLEPLGARVRLEPGLAEGVDGVAVRGDARAGRVAQMIEIDVERSQRGDGRILLAHGTRRRVPGIGERRLPRLLQLPIQPLELRAWHEHLTADLDLRQRGQRPLECQRQAADRAEIGRDVLADPSVAARGPAQETAALVHEGDAEPVDLRLAHVAEGGPRERALEPGLELAQVVRRHGVVEGKHRGAMLDRAERVDGLSGHALGRAVGCYEVGKGRFELAELPHEGVVLGVGDLRSRLGVVEIIVMVDGLSKLGEALQRVGARHAAQHNTAVLQVFSGIVH